MCELWRLTGGGEGARKAAFHPIVVEESAIFWREPAATRADLGNLARTADRLRSIAWTAMPTIAAKPDVHEHRLSVTLV